MKLIITEYRHHEEYGMWGEWSYGEDHGIFGRSQKGMWAWLDGNLFTGVETYEDSISDAFKTSIIKWRELNHRFRRYQSSK